jgi:hypothetical protein
MLSAYSNGVGLNVRLARYGLFCQWKQGYLPYPHPQHLKVVNHLVYICVWSGCECHSMWV